MPYVAHGEPKGSFAATVQACERKAETTLREAERPSFEVVAGATLFRAFSPALAVPHDEIVDRNRRCRASADGSRPAALAPRKIAVGAAGSLSLSTPVKTGHLSPVETRTLHVEA
jgi:hypothetical protein